MRDTIGQVIVLSVPSARPKWNKLGGELDDCTRASSIKTDRNVRVIKNEMGKFKKSFEQDFEAWRKWKDPKKERDRSDLLVEYAHRDPYKDAEIDTYKLKDKQASKGDLMFFESRGTDNKFLKRYICSEHKRGCTASVYIPKNAPNGERLVLLVQPTHKHQRYVNEWYSENGRLRIAEQLIADAELLQNAGVNLKKFDRNGTTDVQLSTDAEQKALHRLTKCRQLFRTNFYDPDSPDEDDKADAKKRKKDQESTIYVLFVEGTERSLSMSDLFKHLGYVGERTTPAAKRAEMNRQSHREILKYIRKLGNSLSYEGMNILSGLANWKRMLGETLLIGLFLGHACDENYQLANKKSGAEPLFKRTTKGQVLKSTYIDENAELDAKVASYLLLQGLIHRRWFGPREADYNHPNPQKQAALERARSDAQKAVEMALKERITELEAKLEEKHGSKTLEKKVAEEQTNETVILELLEKDVEELEKEQESAPVQKTAADELDANFWDKSDPPPPPTPMATELAALSHEQLVARCLALQSNLESRDDLIEDLKSQRDDLIEALKARDDLIEDLKTQKDDLIEALKARDDLIEDLKTQKEARNDLIEALKTQRDDLKRRLASFESAGSTGPPLRKLFRDDVLEDEVFYSDTENQETKFLVDTLEQEAKTAAKDVEESSPSVARMIQHFEQRTQKCAYVSKAQSPRGSITALEYAVFQPGTLRDPKPSREITPIRATERSEPDAQIPIWQTPPASNRARSEDVFEKPDDTQDLDESAHE
ncbi:hypothetical protein M3Y98_00458700 [Aphelenchoides besseyi]|nr:hypothetical protein M3Y98_00458700 [Aphelenchoides besseyi]